MTHRFVSIFIFGVLLGCPDLSGLVEHGPNLGPPIFITDPVESLQQGSATWKIEDPMPVSRLTHGMVHASNGLVYFFGISSPRVDAFDPQSGTWTRMSDAPAELHGRAFENKTGQIYVKGAKYGADPLFHVYAYDLATDSWNTLASLPGVAELDPIVVASGRLFTMGYGLNHPITGDIFEYDPIQDRWLNCPPMPTPRVDFQVVTDGRVVYTLGGYNQTGPPLSMAFEVYNPLSKSWHVLAPLPVHLVGIQGYLNWDGQVIALGKGGDLLVISNHDGIPIEYENRRVDRYDRVSDSWVRESDQPEASYHQGTLFAHGRAWTVGGARDGVAVSTVNSFDPLTGQWKREPSMNFARWFPAVIEIGSETNGTIFVFGGNSDAP